MKKNTFISAVLIAIMVITSAVSVVKANSTKIIGPGSPGGRPSIDNQTQARIDYHLNREVADCSLGVNYPSVVSGVSSPISLTNVAGLGWTASSYAANFTVYVTNTDAVVKLVAFYSLTPSAISSTQEAGIVIGPYDYQVFRVSGRDMGNVHIQGLTGTGKANVQVCTY